MSMMIVNDVNGDGNDVNDDGNDVNDD